MSLQENQTGQLPADTHAPSPEGDDRSRRRRGWVYWALALLTVPAAAVVMVFGIGAAMSVAACNGSQCPKLGPSGLLYGVLLYGAPVVAAVTLAISFLTATRRWGVIVPLCGLALLLSDVAVMAILFRT